MAQPLVVGMPDRIDIGAGYVLQVTAVNPTTGATVSGVNVSNMVIEAEGAGDLSSGAFIAGNPLLITVQA